MAILKKINTTTVPTLDPNNETDIDWIENGERAGEITLNRPLIQVSYVVNDIIDHVSGLDQLSYSDFQTEVILDISSAVSVEESARIAADSTLQNNIDAEVSNRTSADTTLQNNIDAEVTNRIAADNALQTSIDGKALTDGTNAIGTWPISITGSSASATTASTATTATTANAWTTSRTFTIGVTGKTVDGSSNVSWSLPEIGINISTEAQARAGTDSSTLMTPERVTQHHDERNIVSTSTPSGTAPNKSLWLQVS